MAAILGVAGLAFWSEPRGWFFLALALIEVGTSLRYVPAEPAQDPAAALMADEQLPATPAPEPRYWTGTFYGFGAAMAGAIAWYAVTVLSGWELGIVAWLVGRLVGKAVFRGAGNLGDRKSQLIAAALGAYGILLGYFLVIRHYMVEGLAQDGVTGVSELVLAFATVVTIVAQPSVIGVFGLLFIAIGLRDAWHYARAG